MKTMNNLVATLLANSSSALAGHATNRLLERHPSAADRFGRDAFRLWQGHLQVQLRELAVAVEFESPAVFAAALAWSRDSFALREIPDEDLRAALNCLEEIASEELPPPAPAALGPCFAAARQSLEEPESEGPSKTAISTETLAYLEAVLAGQPTRALTGVLSSVHSVDEARRVHLELVPQAQREAGNLWHAAKIGIHEEHLVTTTTRRLLDILADRYRPERETVSCVIGAAIGEDAHDIGVQIINNLFEFEGWRSLCLGSRMPAEDLARAASDFEADLYVLSATLIPHLITLRHAIRCIREQSRPVKVLVGGSALHCAPDLWSKVGADALATNAEEAVRVGTELLR